MREAVELIVKHLVREADSVDVREVERDRPTTVIEIRVAEGDVGKIIGRRGRTVKALRSLLCAGCALAVPESEAVELGEGEFYDWQLEGCRVETVEGRPVGTASKVLHTGGEAPVLVILDRSGRENLVPLAESICVEIDTGRKLI